VEAIEGNFGAIEGPDPDPLQSEKQDPDLHQSDVDPDFFNMEFEDTEILDCPQFDIFSLHHSVLAMGSGAYTVLYKMYIYSLFFFQGRTNILCTYVVLQRIRSMLLILEPAIRRKTRQLTQAEF
jgi:hypothetical protein